MFFSYGISDCVNGFSAFFAVRNLVAWCKGHFHLTASLDFMLPVLYADASSSRVKTIKVILSSI